MQRKMIVSNGDEGLSFCSDNGYTYLDFEMINGNLVLVYDDGISEISEKEEEYYYKQYLKEKQKEREAKEIWVIYSDDEYGYTSRLYKGKGRNSYTFYITEAQKFTRADAQKRAIMMTRNSKVGRKWIALQIK